ncbi:hypothetical protein Bca101_018772 [Brassica carinata]
MHISFSFSSSSTLISVSLLHAYKHKPLHLKARKGHGSWACGIEFGGEDDTVENDELWYAVLIWYGEE